MNERQLYLFGSQRDSEKEPRRYAIVIPLDMLILFTVGIILLLTLSFSLGVEKGKKVASSKLGIQKEKLSEKINISQDSLKQLAEKQKKNIKSSQRLVPVRAVNKLKKYRIQVASFKKQHTAQHEAKQLKKEGYPVLVKRLGKYIVIYVGNFDSEKEAKRNLQSLRKKYKDCILRKL